MSELPKELQDRLGAIMKDHVFQAVSIVNADEFRTGNSLDDQNLNTAEAIDQIAEAFANAMHMLEEQGYMRGQECYTLAR
jgi:hypothetical protein